MGELMLSNRDEIAYYEAVQFSKEKGIVFALKFLKNWILERLASVFPVPSWRVQLHRMRGINIGENVYIGYEVIFDRIHPDYITIDDYAEIGDRCIISAHSRGTLLLRDKYPRSVKAVKIGRGVWMAPGCIVIQGVEIGEMSVIGTGSVVNRNIPPRSVAVGVPAKVIKTLQFDDLESINP